jgi:diguanylate cyclase
VRTGWHRNGAFVAFTAAAAAAVVVHELLPAAARPISYGLISAAPIVPLAVLVRRVPRSARLPWVLLLVAMSVLAAGSRLAAVDTGTPRTLTDVIITVGHGLLLAAALTLVIRRGRNDVGGLIDAAVALMGLGSVLWSSLLQPRLAGHAQVGAQAALLVTIFVLSGVLGALGRLWLAARRMISLLLLVFSLLLALVGNTALAMSTGSLTGHRPPWVETFFLAAYLCVGAAALHPSVDELTGPGPAPVDRLSAGRLVFLGAAMVVCPVIGGGRQLFGLPTDGLLIAVGALAVAPLVMLRIHRLAAQRAAAERALLHQASHDALTGLPNRAELHRRLAAALDRQRRGGPDTVVLLFCDLNGFKLVNDRLGHAVGDRLLAAVAARLRSGLRSGDTVARYGGDEFILLCRNGSAAAVERLREHVTRALAERFEFDGEPIRIGASVGAVVADGTADADELIRRADEAMYEAKQRSRVPIA